MPKCEKFQPDPPTLEYVLTLNWKEAWVVRDALWRLNEPSALEIHRELAREMDGTR